MSDETPDFRSLGARLLQIIPALILVVFANVFICFAVGAIIGLPLLSSEFGKEHRHLTYAIGIGAALLTHAYIVWNHKLRETIKQASHDN